MKKLSLICLVGFSALVLYAPQSMAQNASGIAHTGWYFGAGVGLSTVKDNIAVAGLNYDRDTHDTGYKIFGGYRFTQNLGLEIGYIDFGREKFNWTFSPVERGSGDVKAQNFAITATGRLPMTASFALFGKLGIGTTHIKYNEHWSEPGYSETINVTHRSTVPVAGVGVEYAFHKNVGIRAEYEYVGQAKLDDV